MVFSKIVGKSRIRIASLCNSTDDDVEMEYTTSLIMLSSANDINNRMPRSDLYIRLPLHSEPLVVSLRRETDSVHLILLISSTQAAKDCSFRFLQKLTKRKFKVRDEI